jgi:hypothetical protein
MGKMPSLGKPHSGIIKKPTFGGRPKTADRPPDKKKLEAFGGARPRVTGFDMNVKGNREFGFIQNTEKKATASMMGRAPPKTKTKTTGPARKDAKRQFGKVPGKSPF